MKSTIFRGAQRPRRKFTSIVTGTATETELTWATEDTIEADIEQAFWRANTSRREAVEAGNQTSNPEFLDSHILEIERNGVPVNEVQVLHVARDN